MTLSDYIKKPLRRMNPYRGLVVDVPTWVDAHDYHRAAQRMHSLSLHSPGVVAGLEVVSGGNSPDNTFG